MENNQTYIYSLEEQYYCTYRQKGLNSKMRVTSMRTKKERAIMEKKDKVRDLKRKKCTYNKHLKSSENLLLSIFLLEKSNEDEVQSTLKKCQCCGEEKDYRDLITVLDGECLCEECRINECCTLCSAWCGGMLCRYCRSDVS